VNSLYKRREVDTNTKT